jgi:hypothetical protein
VRASAHTSLIAVAATTWPRSLLNTRPLFAVPKMATCCRRIGPGVGVRWLVRPGRCPCLGAGAAAEQRGGDGADGKGGHDQHGVPGDRGVEADLGLVQPEAALAELEILLGWPAQPGGTDQPGQ